MMKPTAVLCVFAMLTSACGPILKGGALGKSKADFKANEKPADPTPTAVEVPYVPSPVDNEGTLVVNVVDGAAKVSLVTSTKRSAVNVEGEGAITGGGVSGVDLDTKLLCAKTPCAVSLPVGSQTLHIESPPSNGWDSSTDLYDVDVLPKKAQMVTHSMSRVKHQTLSTAKPPKGLVADILLETLGWSAALTGAILIPLEDTRSAGLITLVIGAAMIVAGYAIYKPGTGDHTYTETRPSATTLSNYPP